MSNLLVMLIVAVAIPALLVISVTLYSLITGEHPHRRADDHA